MTREFQAIYRETAVSPQDNVNGPREAVGEVKTVVILAESDKHVRAMLEQSELHVVGVTLIRAVVDWEKPVWDLDEFAAAMNIKGGSLCNKKGNGKIPWNSELAGVPRKLALRYIEEDLNPAGKVLLEKIKEEEA